MSRNRPSSSTNPNVAPPVSVRRTNLNNRNIVRSRTSLRESGMIFNYSSTSTPSTPVIQNNNNNNNNNVPVVNEVQRELLVNQLIDLGHIAVAQQLLVGEINDAAAQNIIGLGQQPAAAIRDTPLRIQDSEETVYVSQQSLGSASFNSFSQGTPNLTLQRITIPQADSNSLTQSSSSARGPRVIPRRSVGIGRTVQVPVETLAYESSGSARSQGSNAASPAPVDVLAQLVPFLPRTEAFNPNLPYGDVRLADLVVYWRNIAEQMFGAQHWITGFDVYLTGTKILRSVAVVLTNARKVAARDLDSQVVLELIVRGLLEASRNVVWKPSDPTVATQLLPEVNNFIQQLEWTDVLKLLLGAAANPFLQSPTLVRVSLAVPDNVAVIGTVLTIILESAPSVTSLDRTTQRLVLYPEFLRVFFSTFIGDA